MEAGAASRNSLRKRTLAAGLMIGGAKPLVVVQCTGFFEAGDAVRNVVHDLELKLEAVARAFTNGQDAVTTLCKEALAVEFVRNQYRHCKAMLVMGAATALMSKADIPDALAPQLGNRFDA